MTEETIAMTQKTVDRLGVVQQVVDRQLRQKEAARQLDLSVRQIKRLVVRYRAEGAAGLVSRHRGRRPNNQIADALRQEILEKASTPPSRRPRPSNSTAGPTGLHRTIPGDEAPPRPLMTPDSPRGHFSLGEKGTF